MLPKAHGTTHVQSAREMAAAVEGLLPADAGIFVVAVADWRPQAESGEKTKKRAGEAAPALQLTENPDILAGSSASIAPVAYAASVVTKWASSRGAVRDLPSPRAGEPSR